MTTLNHIERLNRMAPAAFTAELGQVLDDLITQHNALLAKLDADTGLDDSDYVSTLKITPLSERQPQ